MTVNVKNLDKLIAALEAAPEDRFDMRNYVSQYGDGTDEEIARDECGSAACIAGWCMWLGLGKAEKVAAFSFAKNWLGLIEYEARDLFTPNNLSSIRLPDAIGTLKRLRKTGEVNWGYRHAEVAR